MAEDQKAAIATTAIASEQDNQTDRQTRSMPEEAGSDERPAKRLRRDASPALATATLAGHAPGNPHSKDGEVGAAAAAQPMRGVAPIKAEFVSHRLRDQCFGPLARVTD